MASRDQPPRRQRPGPWPPAPEAAQRPTPPLPQLSWAKRTGFKGTVSGESNASDSGQIALPKPTESGSKVDLEAGTRDRPSIALPPPLVASVGEQKSKERGVNVPAPVDQGHQTARKRSTGSGPNGHVVRFDTRPRESREEEPAALPQLEEEEGVVLRQSHINYELRDSPGLGGYFSCVSNQIEAADAMLPSALDTILPPGAISNGVSMNLSAFPLKKNPVSRPVRHNGPPPGFSYIGSKQPKGGIPNSFTKEQLYEIDDYSWLDDSRSFTKGTSVVNSFDQITHTVPCVDMNNTTPFTTVSTFPFPGKQVLNMQSETVNGRRWHDFQLFEQLKAYNGQQSQHLNPPQTLLPEQHQSQSLWSSGHFV